MQRVSPNTEVLFKIELKQIVDVPAASWFDILPNEDNQKSLMFIVWLSVPNKEIYTVKIKIESYVTIMQPSLSQKCAN